MLKTELFDIAYSEHSDYSLRHHAVRKFCDTTSVAYWLFKPAAAK